MNATMPIISSILSGSVLLILIINTFNNLFFQNRKSFEDSTKELIKEVTNLKINFSKIENIVSHQNEKINIRLEQIFDNIKKIDSRITTLEKEIDSIRRNVEEQKTSSSMRGEISLIRRQIVGSIVRQKDDDDDDDDVKQVESDK